jgi:biotin operon repressor
MQHDDLLDTLHRHERAARLDVDLWRSARSAKTQSGPLGGGFVALLTVFCQYVLLLPRVDPMKRDERLFDLVQILRDGKLHTAGELAQAVGVSTRTIWRDMAMMAATGIPVEGERGLGYILRTPLVLPATALTQDEATVLGESLRLVAEDESHPRSRAARTLLYKVATLLPQAGIVVE